MDRERHLAPSNRLLRLAARFHDKQYRDAYVAAHAREILAKQMRSFRGELPQAEYAEKIGKQKTVIGRLENPAYSGWSLRTMLEIARKENVGVLAQFVDFPTFLNFTDDLSDDVLHPREYNETQTDDIASYLSGAKTYYDLGGGYIAGGTAAAVPTLYGDIFFGAIQAGLTLPRPGSITLANTYSGTVGQTSNWLSPNVVLGQNIMSPVWQPTPPLPSGIAHTQAAIRWLSDLAVSQKNQIEALQSELASLRRALSSHLTRTTQQSDGILLFPRHMRRQTFGNPLNALGVEEAA
jgi:hypothetical protein